MGVISHPVPEQDSLVSLFVEELKKEESSSTKDLIYDAAERAFGEKGFHGATIREIFKIADVNTGLMSYYFSSKEELYVQCVQRRMDLLNRMYLATVDELLKETDGTPGPFDICYAYIRFFLLLVAHKSLGLSDYVKLLAQTASVYGNYDFEEIMRPFGTIIDTTIELLSKALPFMERETVKRNFHYLEFGIVTMICTDRIRLLRFGDIEDDAQLERISRQMADFYARGMIRA